MASEKQIKRELIEARLVELESQQMKDAIAEIKNAQQKMHQFTVRDVSEATLGEKATTILYGKEGGNIPLSEVDLGVSLTGEGVVTRMSDEMAKQVGEQELSLDDLAELDQHLEDAERIAFTASIESYKTAIDEEMDLFSTSKDKHIGDLLKHIQQLDDASVKEIIEKLKQ